MPAKSVAQQKAAAIVLNAKRKNKGKRGLGKAAKGMYGMSVEELKKFASGSQKGKPYKVKKKNESYVQETLDSFINESKKVFEFHKGNDPLKSLGLGVHAYNTELARKRPREVEQVYEFPFGYFVKDVILRMSEGNTMPEALEKEVCSSMYYNVLKNQYERDMMLFRFMTMLSDDFGFSVNFEEYKKLGKKLKLLEFHKVDDPMKSLSLGKYAPAHFDTVRQLVDYLFVNLLDILRLDSYDDVFTHINQNYFTLPAYARIIDFMDSANHTYENADFVKFSWRLGMSHSSLRGIFGNDKTGTPWTTWEETLIRKIEQYLSTQDQHYNLNF